ncbi:hypothetical protein [Streptomyces sp. NPDC057682]|uniref:hypothetical protein n=1 Tax=Streptomyces sp. NPDC057682 TaxID=3346210 RepID=UPI003692366C
MRSLTPARSARTARSARLLLTATAVAALALTATACGPEDIAGADGSTASPAAATGGSGKPSGDTAGQDTSGGSSSSGTPDAGTGGDQGDSGSGGGDKSGYGQSCGTNDLDLTVTWEARPISHYIVTAKAKSGITCYLDVNTPSVSFGSKAEGVASPVGQGGEDPIKLGGSAVAHAGISPKTTPGDAGVQFDHVVIAVREDDPDPADVELPDTATVEKPIVTNWSTRKDEVVPRII